MRWIAILLSLLFAAAGARAEQPILQLDTGGHMALIQGLAFTPDGKFIVSVGDDKVIRVWDWRAGKTVRTIRGQSGQGNEGKIYAMALSPDGRWLAVGGWLGKFTGTRQRDEEEAHQIRLYDFASGELKALLKGHTDVVLGLAFSPDGKKLISGSGPADRSAIIWDVETNALVHRLEGHRNQIFAVLFAPDGTRAVTGSDDTTLRLWSVAGGALIAEMPGHGDMVRSLAVSPRDGTIASGDYSGQIRLWNAGMGTPLTILANQGGEVRALNFAPNSSLLMSTYGYCASCQYKQRIWNAKTGHEVTGYVKHDNAVIAGAFSPDGKLVATGGGNNQEIHIWDPKTGETKTVLKGTGKPGWAVGFSAESRSIAWGNTWTQHDPKSGYGPLKIALRLPTAGEILSPPLAQPLRQAQGEDQGWVRANASFGALSLQHRKGGSYGYDAILDVLKYGKTSGVSIELDSTDGEGHWAYSFTPNGKSIISGGNGFLTAFGLDGKKIGNFVGHEGVIWAVAPSPDGKYLVSGSNDQTVRLWNLKTRELLITIFRGEDGEWVAWTPEGFYTGSEGAAKLVGWQINQGPEKAARYITAGQLRKALFRPDLVTAKILGDPDGQVKETAVKLNIDELLKTAAAPQVAILSPENGAKFGEASVTITARITDTGGGVGRIGFKLNGQAVGAAYGAAMLDKDGTITRSFDLATAATEIEIVAEDKAGKIQSLPAKIAVHADKAIQSSPDLYVLAIGADLYRDRRVQLKFAVKDATALAETFQAAGAGYYGNPPIVTTLFDNDVSDEKVEAAFKALSAKVKATDVFVFYIAGHGKTIDGDFYYVPPSLDSYSDEALKAQGYGPSKLWAWFEQIKAQKSIWIFDTCESGSAERVFKTRGLAEADAALKRLKDATGRTIFMASTEQQAALEGYRNHGVFTYALLESLAKAGGGERVQLYDIADYVQTRVPEISRELSGCETKDVKEFCQKPIVGIGSTPNYPIMPRYPQVLAMLGAPTRTDAAPIPLKPTHAVIANGDVFETLSRGAPLRQILAGELVAVIGSENGLAHIAKDGAVLGYVEQSKLLKLIR